MKFYGYNYTPCNFSDIFFLRNEYFCREVSVLEKFYAICKDVNVVLHKYPPFDIKSMI